MVKAIARLALAGSIILASASQALAHHSAAAYDTAKEVRVTGTVLQYRFANPHVYLTQPAQWSGKWEYRPTMRHSNQKCDVEVARRFLQQ